MEIGGNTTGENMQISVSEPEKRPGKFIGSHMRYNVTVVPAIPGVVSVSRRFKDFLWLRNKLHMQLPGAFIPPLPPKDFMHRFEDDFVAERRSDLERFLNRCAATPHVASTEVFQSFLSKHEQSWEEGKKNISLQLKSLTSAQLAHQLAMAFPHACNYELGDSLSLEENCLRLHEFAARSYDQLQVLYTATRSMVEHTREAGEMASKMSETLCALNKVETNYAARPSPDRLKVDEQFGEFAGTLEGFSELCKSNLEHCVKHEMQDAGAFVEIVKERQSLKAKLDKARAKADKWRNQMATAQLTPKQQQTRDEDFAKEHSLNDLLRIVTQIILSSEVQKVWSAKIANFRESIQQLASEQITNSRKMHQVWQSVAEQASA
ncbi:MAG: hypothetical protein MHM6MM_000132 [Cercozoa sp. M6MM]